MSGLCLEDPSPQGLEKTTHSHQRLSMLTYSVFDMWGCRLTSRNRRVSSQKHFVSLQQLYQYIKMWQYFQASCLCMTGPFAKIFPAWWEKLVVQGSVNRLFVVLCGSPCGNRWTQKECWAKWNVLPVHLIHIKSIIFGHLLRLYLFFIAVTWGDWQCLCHL